MIFFYYQTFDYTKMSQGEKNPQGHSDVIKSVHKPTKHALWRLNLQNTLITTNTWPRKLSVAQPVT